MYFPVPPIRKAVDSVGFCSGYLVIYAKDVNLSSFDCKPATTVTTNPLPEIIRVAYPFAATRRTVFHSIEVVPVITQYPGFYHLVTYTEIVNHWVGGALIPGPPDTTHMLLSRNRRSSSGISGCTAGNCYHSLRPSSFTPLPS